MSEQTGDTPDSLRPAGGVEADDPPDSGEGAGIRPREAPAGRGGGRFGGALQRATMWMAAGTALSRLTGLLRVLVLAYALGATHLATSYNLANTTPNMLYDIVLGGVLSATFIPVFVDRLATRSERDAWRAISAVISLAAVVLVVMTVVFWVAAPGVIAGFTALDHTRTVVQQHGLGRERAVATSLLRWFVPQVALYGFIALLTALLNTRRRFVAPDVGAHRQQRGLHRRAAVVPPADRRPVPGRRRGPPRLGGPARPGDHPGSGPPGACSW